MTRITPQSDSYFDNLMRFFLAGWTLACSITLALITDFILGLIFFIVITPLALIAYELRPFQ